jgi:2-dehydropantoate 2-reductase
VNFLVIGAGGVGGFFGGLLHQSGHHVQFLARGKHLAAIRDSGLRVESPAQTFTVPANCFFDTASNAAADVVLFCVKSYDTEQAARSIQPATPPGSIIISLQNGLENEASIQRLLPQSRVLGGVAYVASLISSPGVVTETGGPRKIVFGSVDGKSDERLEEILATFKRAGIHAELSQNILAELWRKFVFITAVGGMTAVTRLNLGELLASEESRLQLQTAMNESASVATAKGIQLPANLTDHFMETIARFKPDTYSSLHFDLTHEKPLEIDALSGAVVKFGKEVGVPTPLHELIYSSLIPFHIRHLELRRNA